MLSSSVNALRVTCPAALQISPGIPSRPGDLTELTWPSAFTTFSSVGGRSSDSWTGFCGIRPRALESTVEGLFSKVFKWSFQRACMLFLFFRRVEPSGDIIGVVQSFAGQYTAHELMHYKQKMCLHKTEVLLSADMLYKPGHFLMKYRVYHFELILWYIDILPRWYRLFSSDS